MKHTVVSAAKLCCLILCHEKYCQANDVARKKLISLSTSDAHLSETRDHPPKYHTLTIARTISLHSRNAMSRYFSIVTLFLLTAGSVFAQDAKNPLRFVPGQVELVLKIDRPRLLVEMVESHELFKKAIKLAGVREYYDT